jgi:hypothetical protein
MTENRQRIAALARHFQIYSEACRVVARLDAEARSAALERALHGAADPRDVVVAALIVQSEPRLLDGLVAA